MCIIAAKPANVEMPDAETIRNMWYSNPNGAGFMYAKDGLVHIEKGFMTLTSLENRLEALAAEIDTKKTAIVLHFRITTSGGTKPENCHPFPVSDNIPVLQKLKSKTNLGVTHNGIIPITTRNANISDTMEYIASQLAPLHRFAPKFFENKDALLLVKNGIKSKMCFLTPDGALYTIGDFETDKGILYSNGSYLSYYKSGRWGNFGYYSGYLDDYLSIEDNDDTRYEEYWDAYAKKYRKKYKTNSASAIDGFTMLNDHGIYVEPRYLMWLEEIAGFGVTKKGEMIEGFNLYMDRWGNAWEYDHETDTCFRKDNITLYDAHGCFPQFKNELAEQYYCSIGS